MATSETNQGLAELITLYKQLGAISAVIFAPLARTYVGTLEQGELRTHEGSTAAGGNAAVVNLALRKLAFEAGEMLMANNPPTDKPIAEFKRDESGKLPDLSLAYVAAAALAYVKSRDEKQAARAAAAPAAPQVELLRATSVRALRASARTTAYTSAPRMMTAPPLMTAPPPVTVRPTGGCGCGGKTTPATSTGGCGCGGGCGGTSMPPPQPVPCYDPCAGGLVAVPPTETCGCPACQPPATTGDCPVVTISCETKLRLRDCIKQLLCDLIEYLETKLCANAQPGTPIAILCNFLHCVREAICPDPVPTPLPPGPSMPCLPCGYAVEIP